MLQRQLVEAITARALDAVERGQVPDPLVRVGIRRILSQRLAELDEGSASANLAAKRSWLVNAAKAPIALSPELANEQHYEVPARLFEIVLGRHLKYSCGLYNDDTRSLDDAEAAMLALSCERSQIEDGQRVLDLGCGWGSLSLWLAERYPKSSIVGVSNSSTQRSYIEAQARARRLDNVAIVTADINDFEPTNQFDRVMSIEMFEHVRNHQLLLNRITRWLTPDGKLFVHHFCHREHVYAYEDLGPADWMARYFFSGGMMPSDDLLLYHQQELSVQDHWIVDGLHYQATSEAWLSRLDAQRDTVLELFRSSYGDAHAALWFQRWRLFFLACAELFGYQGGRQWWVAHYLMRR